MSTLFFQQFWHIIGVEVISYYLDILNNRGPMAETNHTNIVLILKHSMPINMMHFRPISLCNILLKIVTSVIVHRLQMIMPH